MTWNSGPCIDDVPEAVVTAIDAINAQLGWPGGRPAPCVGHMVHDHRPIDGIDVTLGSERVEITVAGVTVGTGRRWPAFGNAYLKCHLPHTWPHDPHVAALNQGGALNAFQLHLLTLHGTHCHGCTSVARSEWCHLCRGERA
ncbi:hypothetical protein B0I32_106320 [Nonomuraea fuscirosea]|uniref:Uncharacterized protein n=1 Tax=Nonomuraea fuscirosea TaxID=1291556 RepID=A0A2T0N2I4_9ACTN|nr:hypothetical protein [Nonomuraea fuscirosea]PRX66184.1 hypothetical protein B0I32_106320 [Nonomuraea fuscirosea]